MSTTNFSDVKDSGERQTFSTGSVRDTSTGKGRFDLLSPLALRRLAVHTENGARKYGDRNWEKGQPIMRFLDSAIRHIYKHIEGLRDEDHLAAGAWNLMAAIHMEEAIERELLPKELDDRPTHLMERTPQAPALPDLTVKKKTIDKSKRKRSIEELRSLPLGTRVRYWYYSDTPTTLVREAGETADELFREENETTIKWWTGNAGETEIIS